ncbi:MAG: tRNA threonylcarbamoyladenosine dehydratase, partial [Myxococcota bacterium]
GLGGVGSWTVEALARSGVGQLTLVDLDDVCISNTNRQLHALTNTVGHSKAAVLGQRVKQISPDTEVEVVEDFFTASSADAILERPLSVVVDAIDSFKNKCVLLDACRTRALPAVVVGGAGGRTDPSAVRLEDISKSEGCRLLAMLRKRLRQKHRFPRTGSWGVPCVYSPEPPRFPDGHGGVCALRPDTSPGRLDCSGGFGAATFVTGTFGFFAAKAAVDQILASP